MSQPHAQAEIEELRQRIIDEVDSGKYEDLYAEYIEEHTVIGNNHMLIAAIESGRYFDDFIDHLMNSL
jgi:hypothetical protein